VDRRATVSPTSSCFGGGKGRDTTRLTFFGSRLLIAVGGRTAGTRNGLVSGGSERRRVLAAKSRPVKAGAPGGGVKVQRRALPDVVRRGRHDDAQSGMHQKGGGDGRLWPGRAQPRGCPPMKALDSTRCKTLKPLVGKGKGDLRAVTLVVGPRSLWRRGQPSRPRGISQESLPRSWC